MANSTWTEDFRSWQSACRAEHARADSIRKRIDTQIRDLADKCGFAREMPLLTAHNWGLIGGKNRKCAHRMHALQHRAFQAHSAASRACDRLHNRMLAGKHGVREMALEPIRGPYREW